MEGNQRIFEGDFHQMVKQKLLHGCIVKVVLLHIFMFKLYCYLTVVYSYT